MPGKISDDTAATAGTLTGMQFAAAKGGANYRVSETLIELPFDTRTAATAASITSTRNYLRTAGHTTVGKGGALHKKSATVPSHGVAAAYFQSADASGYWDLSESVITPFMFGAVGDGATDDGTALNNFFAYAAAVRVVANCEGNFATSVAIIAGAASGTVLTKDYRGHMKVTALAAISVVVTLYNMTFCIWDGKVEAIGTGSSTFSTRTCDIGVLAKACGRLKIGAVHGENFRFGAFVTDHATNNNAMQIGFVRASNCSSGATDASSLTANWSNPVNSGSSNSNGQATALDVDEDVPSWATDLTVPVGVFINDLFYLVASASAGTISIGPWLEPTDLAGGSGTLRYVIGAGCNISGSNGGVCEIGLGNADGCGVGYRNSATYGSTVGQIVAQNDGIGAWFGLTFNSSHRGFNIGNLYVENNTLDLLYMPSLVNEGFIGSTNEHFDFAKVLPFDRGRTTGQTGQPRSALFNLSIGSYKGRPLFYEKNALHTAAEIAAVLAGNNPHREYVYVSNSVSVTLPELDDDIDQLFGYNARTVTLIGTGAEGAPTGTVTWTAPGGQTVNGAASVAYSGFARSPARFVMRYERTTSDWVVYCTTPNGVAFQTFTDQDATPSVANGRNFKAANTVATTITAFDSGFNGQEINVVFTTANTTIDFTGTALEGNAGSDWAPAANDHMTCIYDGTNWFCRISDNSA
jgi:hypothetical protein